MIESGFRCKGRERPLDAGELSQRDSFYQVALLALREAARVQRA